MIFLQILTGQFNEGEAMASFKKVDQTLDSLGVTHDEKLILYMNLSAILHLSNVEFTNNNDDSEAQITNLTQKHLIIAAKLMNVPFEDLEKSMLFRSIDIAGSVTWLVSLLISKLDTKHH